MRRWQGLKGRQWESALPRSLSMGNVSYSPGRSRKRHPIHGFLLWPGHNKISKVSGDSNACTALVRAIFYTSDLKGLLVPLFSWGKRLGAGRNKFNLFFLKGSDDITGLRAGSSSFCWHLLPPPGFCCLHTRGIQRGMGQPFGLMGVCGVGSWGGQEGVRET